uniref:Uncharacterized protein n=1 Tax=Rangifer tarandus platyrhynchus TaxID=3082113 RepID=A0ACB0EMZ3_RANTA|nr:unnamed protein product [Rangifer tarandus platyrhynchus]
MLPVGHTADKINQERDRQGVHRLTEDRELKSTAKQLSMSVIAGCGNNTGKTVKDVRHGSPGAFWADGGSLSGPGARDGDSSSVLPAEAPLMTSGCSFLHASALWSSEIWSWRPHLFCSPF